MTYTVRIEDGMKLRTITCDVCGNVFEVARKMPARGRWPKRCQGTCSVESNRTQSRERQRKVRSGEHKPAYAAARPYWNRSDHNGPGSRTAISNLSALGRTHSSSDDEEPDEVEPIREVDAVDALHDVLTEKDKRSTPAVKMAPAYTGDEESDRYARALVLQNSNTSFFTNAGVNVGRTNPSIPTTSMDEEARAWLRDHPDWHREERTEDGGWGCRPGQYADPDHLEDEELRFILGIDLDDDDDDLMREIAREREEEINRLLKLSA